MLPDMLIHIAVRLLCRDNFQSRIPPTILGSLWRRCRGCAVQRMLQKVGGLLIAVILGFSGPPRPWLQVPLS
eukprot:1979802-Pyramimonas_sp.AAC.1